MYTGQDRYIQKELAFTPAKNATKPNPFKIVPLQSTRKENGWETEETERAAVTVEMEQFKWPNPYIYDDDDDDDDEINVTEQINYP
jgi:hypothetical protein